jgi:putative endonuclease
VTEPAYSVYLVRCRDGSLYTGIATDVARRIREHEDSPRGAKFLRGKGPLTLVYQREIGDRSTASRIEFAIKQLPKADKSDQALLSARIDAALSEIKAVSRE